VIFNFRYLNIFVVVMQLKQVLEVRSLINQMLQANVKIADRLGKVRLKN
jgi:hypothetical protein